MIYRKDQYKAAGIKSTPKSLAQFMADGKKLMKKYGKDSAYSAVYFPGKYWYAAMSFVYDYGGQIAVRKGGKWKGTLNTPRALAALESGEARIAKTLTRASKTTDEANPQQSLVFAKGKVGSFIGNGWEWPYALDAKVGNPALAPVVGAYPMPSHTKGKFMPDVPRRLRPRGPGDHEEPEPGRRLDQGVHEHGSGERDREGGQYRQHDDTPRLQRLEPEAGAVRTGGEVQLVRPHQPELGQRGECERAAGHARQDLHRPRVGEGSGQYGQ